jgi:hypothetical protein
VAVRYRIWLLAAPAIALFASLASGAVPSPASSTIPGHIVGSPDGAFVAQVVVRDFANNPIQGSTVVLDFSDCPQFHPCPNVCAECIANPATRSVRRVTDAAGVAAFGLRLGGGNCPNPPTVRVSADGVPLGTTNFASLDQDGDLSLTNNDIGLVHAVLGSPDLRADFDGDGMVTVLDEGILLGHLDATCDPSTPVRTRTWGGLKTIYR